MTLEGVNDTALNQFTRWLEARLERKGGALEQAVLRKGKDSPEVIVGGIAEIRHMMSAIAYEIHKREQGRGTA